MDAVGEQKLPLRGVPVGPAGVPVAIGLKTTLSLKAPLSLVYAV
jgi:hypothetical protein